MTENSFKGMYNYKSTNRCLDNKLAWSIGIFNRFRIYRKCKLIDSGPHCIRIISAYWGVKHSINTIKKDCEIKDETFSVANLCQCGKNIGLDAKVLKTHIETLSYIDLPIVLKWKNGQYVILYDIDYSIWGHIIYVIADPTTKKKKFIEKDIQRLWCDNDRKEGPAIVINPTPDLYSNPLGKRSILYAILNKIIARLNAKSPTA